MPQNEEWEIVRERERECHRESEVFWAWKRYTNEQERIINYFLFEWDAQLTYNAGDLTLKHCYNTFLRIIYFSYVYCKDTELLYHFFMYSGITSFHYLSITCNAFIACYIMWQNI